MAGELRSATPQLVTRKNESMIVATRRSFSTWTDGSDIAGGSGWLFE